MSLILNVIASGAKQSHRMVILRLRVLLITPFAKGQNVVLYVSRGNIIDRGY